MQRALVIEDDPDMRMLLSDLLMQSGLEPVATSSGRQGLDRVEEVNPDLVVLDLTLPDLDGIEVCRQLRARTDAYVIMLTGRAEEIDRLIGLEVGADDYMTKPFSPRELRARVAALFRRPRADSRQRGAKSAESAPDDEARLVIGDLEIDLAGRDARCAGKPLTLTRIEFDLLATLASKPGRVWERETLLRRVWQTGWSGGEHAVDVHVANLRKKLGSTGMESNRIRTVRGVGYRLDA